MAYLDFILKVHNAAKRDYVARVTEADKAECATISKQFGFDYFDGDRKYGYGGFRYDGRWLPVAQAMVKHYGLPDNARILDVGCAKGFLVHDFMKVLPGGNAIGVDVSEYAIANAMPEVKERVSVGNAVSLPYPDKSFDLVVSINTLHNLRIYDLEKALKEIERVGKQHKYIVMDSYRDEREKVNLLYWQLTCECIFTPKEWEWIFATTGYTGDYGCVFLNERGPAEPRKIMTDDDPKTREPQYQRAIDLRKTGLRSLGLMTNQAWEDDPRHLLFTLARYKFVAKMLSGAQNVLEVGCADAFGTRLVAQEVAALTAIDFDPVFVDDVNQRMSERWTFQCKVHDMLTGPLPEPFDGIYALDVVEHIDRELEDRFLKNMTDSLGERGVLILGTPSLQSQVHASPQSKAGHVNCKDGVTLKELLSRFFHNVFIFSMNDEVVHTGYYPMAHYLFGIACSRRG